MGNEGGERERETCSLRALSGVLLIYDHSRARLLLAAVAVTLSWTPSKREEGENGGDKKQSHPQSLSHFLLKVKKKTSKLKSS